MTLWAYNRPFKILGCDEFTAAYYLEKYGKSFPVGGFEDLPQKDRNSKLKYLIFKYRSYYPSLQWIRF
jgi:hypothetical protein